ncbi:MAG TPA: RimK family protein [Burkholderiales bacterium]|nr:RimK family protein [Burkholderiales bacterium]
MSSLVVVNDPGDWPLDMAGVAVSSARAYLSDPRFDRAPSLRVHNLCSSYRYQTLGYYVSLLAEARGHKPLPRVRTIEDMHSQPLVRHLTEGLNKSLQRALSHQRADSFDLDVYFGRSVAERCGHLSGQLFNLLQAPLLRARLERPNGHWHIRGVRPLAVHEIPAEHRAFMIRAATQFFTGRSPRVRKRPAPLYDLAILHDPANPEPASDAAALRKFVKAAELLRVRAELVTEADLDRLPEFDALFIRDTTFVNHYTYRFSRRALAEGLVVIDDPESILKCNNKVYLAQLLDRHGVPTPKTLLVRRDNVERIVPTLGLPCVLKQPDSSFSNGVVKAESESDLRARVLDLLDKSELIVAQEYLPTEFDWRIGILNQRPLFAAKYFMAPGHWQVIKHDAAKRDHVEGPTVAVALSEVPKKVVKLGLRAANLIGDGFYGVDIKEAGGGCCVIEVNDNPNVDAGNEDGVLEDALYRAVMELFVHRIQARRWGHA